MPRPRIDWRFAGLATLAVTCLFTLQSMGSGPSGFAVAHRHQLVEWAIWLTLTPLIVLATRRLAVGEGSAAGWLGRQLVLGAAFAGASLAIGATIQTAFDLPAPAGGLASRFAGELLRYAIIAMAYQTVASYRAARDREITAARLRAELAEAKLANLEGRLHPHFLFNTLNSIAALVREDPRAAETMVEQLAELLRASLAAQPHREVSLGDELALVDQYLGIQRMRFRDRLAATTEASDAARAGLVPQLLLQPLVENAIRHGIGPKEGGGTVAVTGRVEGDELVLTVDDDGVGFGRAPRATAGNGIGLDSVRARLAHLYGARHRLEIGPGARGGTRVQIALPYRVAP